MEQETTMDFSTTLKGGERVIIRAQGVCPRVSMREIKFRGKTFGGKWVEGYYVVEKSTGKHKITDGLLDIDEVKAETIGMGTGVLDKDGTEIFEGDVVQNGEGGYFYVVCWWSEDAAFRGKQVGSSSTIGLNYWRKELRIVGNVHDNPELLQYKPAPPKRRDRHTLLPGEFRIKGVFNNGEFKGLREHRTPAAYDIAFELFPESKKDFRQKLDGTWEVIRDEED